MKTVVLLSGGLDSTVVLAEAIDNGDEVVAISFDYGQTHRGQELAAAKKIAAHYDVRHRIVGMASALVPSALTGSYDIPDKHAEQPDSTTVPGRNLMLIATAAAIAEAEGAREILVGCNADDYAGYADCRPEFIEAADRVVKFSTEWRVGVRAPLLHRTKRRVVALGRRLDAPIEMSWSCYRGGVEPCGRCGACESRDEALL